MLYIWNLYILNINYASKKKKSGLKKKTKFQSFLGGSVVKNPATNAGDMGSIPDPGRSHVHQSK